MSLLIHRCTDCGHAEHEHRKPGACSTGYCPCKKRSVDLIAQQGGALLDRIIAPGENWGGQMGGWSVACSCDSCVAEYERLTGVSVS